MYLSRKDFITHGHTPGCPGCLDIASGKPGPSSSLAAHTKACRSRMNEAIRAADPARWERYLRRRGEDPAVVEGPPPVEAVPGTPLAIEEANEEGEDGVGDLFESEAEGPSGLGGGDAGSGSGPASSSLGAVAGPGDEESGSGTGPDSDSPGSTELVDRFCSIDVCEVFSPPRVGRAARRHGITPGDAMDLTTGWDFNLESHRKMAEEYIDKHRPLVVIGSPPCTPFSQLQAFSPNSKSKAAKWREGVRHMEFVVKLYRKQLDAGRVFLHENPAHASSWALPVIRKMMAEVGVDVVETDQCMFGLKTWGNHKH